MAWLARSIANSLKLDEEDEDDETNTNHQSPSLSESQSPRGVKEDISELTKTLRTQFWGVASFLAPPTEINQSPDRAGDNNDEEEEEEDEDLIAGIRNDFAEIGGRFKTEISKLSGNLPVSEFTKIASSFLQLGSESVDPKDYVSIGITEDLVAFVKDLAIHPENWLDFALPDEDDDDEDNFHNFEMTDEQHEHALAMERLVPSLASLRIELCPEYMNENCFWKIYFVLVNHHHPKLNKQDPSISILSTPQVLELNKSPSESSSEANVAIVKPLNAPLPESESAKTVNPDIETEKHPIDESKEIQVVIEERNNTSLASSRVINVKVEDEEDDDDDWLNDEEEETSESVSAMKRATKNGEDDEEEVSFSDLEEDDDDEEGDKKVTNSGSSDSSSSKYSTDWVKLKADELM